MGSHCIALAALNQAQQTHPPLLPKSLGCALFVAFVFTLGGYFEMWFHCVAQAGLKVMVTLLLRLP